MKIPCLIGSSAGLFLLAATTSVAQTTTTTGFAPSNFGDVILTSTPSNATGNSGVSTVFSNAGSTFTFGTGGKLVNPAAFNYTLTGPNTALISTPASGNNPAVNTTLNFSSENAGTFTTVSGNTTTSGNFSLAEIPSSAPIANVSVLSDVTSGGSTAVGFVIAGTMPRKVLIRAVGPGLTSFGLRSTLSNPALTLYRNSRALFTQGAWGSAAKSGTGTTGTGTTGSGSTGTGTTGTGTTGTGSTGTGTTGTGTTGTGTTGTTTTGTTITVTPTMATESSFSRVGAFPLTAGSNDAATVVTLEPGAYTIVVSASASGTGTTGTGTTGTGTTGTGTTGTGTTGTGTTGTGTTGTGTTGTGTTGTGTTGTGTTGTGTTGTGTTGTGTTGTGTTGTGTTGTGTTGTGTTGTGTTTTTGGEVLVEVYFVE